MVRRVWIAFCTGWWIAGGIFGIQHFFELLARPRPTAGLLAVIGVPLLAGVFLPGARPVYVAAEIGGTSGLPTGFIGFFIGILFGIFVWVTLPLALHEEFPEMPRTVLIASLVPYMAGFVGIRSLYQHYREQNQGKMVSASRSLAIAGIAYFGFAAILLGFTVGLLIV